MIKNLKKEEKSVKEEIKIPDIEEVSKEIEKLDYDFGRGDLNLMRDKINEIIEHGN